MLKWWILERLNCVRDGTLGEADNLNLWGWGGTTEAGAGAVLATTCRKGFVEPCSLGGEQLYGGLPSPLDTLLN